MVETGTSGSERLDTKGAWFPGGDFRFLRTLPMSPSGVVDASTMFT